ncbi:MAG: YihY/virulence factor BrkB family protein [Chloroflexi bacterium]|nr:YihY/virulence factor BrkB family protein [Chloroflexota bacterium]
MSATDRRSDPAREPDVSRESLRDRAATFGKGIADQPRVRAIRGVLDGAGDAGVGLLAAGLAFHALFAVLPGLLLLVGLSGFVIEDAERRAVLIRELISRVPPLAGPVSDTLERLVRDRSAVSILGLIGLAWGASNFYGSLEEAMVRVFPGGRPRGLVQRRLRGFLAIAVLLVAAILAIAVGGLLTVIEAALGPERVGFLGLVGSIATAILMGLAVLVVFLAIPTAPPTIRAALFPAIVTGLGIALLTDAFALVAKLLVGALAQFGVLAAVFGVLIWLNYVFTVLIFGAVWARLRRDRLAPLSPPRGIGSAQP